ncbi:MAG TPA: ribose-phosphate pyrophosphokinase [Puia sp.]|uniref:ribose-phosphate diphosphokinase n=1 Tax=Puia sp. TaxID=2045100 RepID=UPI002CFD6445|nr:ribose-phosphate pyrophosphokinase [Puia sp.]HVU97085.1 ribose-phosphate pyrophosphokinase [Puia sp.]
MILFALNSSRDFGEAVALELDMSLGEHEEVEFEDGENKCRPLENVRGRNVFVIQSLYSDKTRSVNDKLCRLLFFISALKDASAKHVTAIVPYLCYARKDRKTKPRDPITTRYVAQLFEAAGTDRIVTIDVHNIQAFQNAFRIPSEHLEAQKVFADFLIPQIENDEIVIMSPDIGGIKRAEQFQRLVSKRLHKDLRVAFMEKYRSSGEVWGEAVVGDVKGKTVVIIDDLVSTGGTLARSAAACKRQGAKKVVAVATHGIFTGQPDKTLGEEGLDQIVITNTIPPFRLENTQVKQKVKILSVAPLFAEAIRRLDEGGSITGLLED